MVQDGRLFPDLAILLDNHYFRTARNIRFLLFRAKIGRRIISRQRAKLLRRVKASLPRAGSGCLAIYWYSSCSSQTICFTISLRRNGPMCWKSFFSPLGLLWLGVQFYALPYFMLQEEKSLRTAWRNGIFTILAAPVYTLILWIFGVLIVVLSVGTVIPLFLGVPGIIVVLGSQAVTERLITFEIIEEHPNKQ